MKEVQPESGLYTEAEFHDAVAGNENRQAQTEKDELISAQDAQQITVITLMRIYDVLGAILNHLDEDQAEALMTRHANGELVGPLPSLNI